mgnify:CR=1 FL=1
MKTLLEYLSEQTLPQIYMDMDGVLVDLEKRLRPYKSVICNTVHDSIVIDCHPDEEEQVVAILKFSMLGVAADLKKRYKINYLMPVEIEIKKGENWLDTNVVYPVE